MFTDFISFADLTSDDLLSLMDLAADLKQMAREGKTYQPLERKTLAMLFEKPSLRTHVTFEVGVFQLGGHSIILKTILGERETIPDIARNLERWVEGIAARTFSHDTVIQLAEYASVPVINALTDKLHPCQILADALTLREHKGPDFSSLKLTFVGDGNNVFNSWLEFAARFPLSVALACPKGYEPDADILAFAKREAKGQILITHDLESALKDADAVYTDVWASMGQEDEAEDRAKIFAPYQVNAAVMKMAKKDAIFMHCLPAHRGSEVTDEVMDSPQSVVFDEAENRLHAQKAVMVTLM